MFCWLAGILGQVDKVLCIEAVLERWVEVAEGGNILAAYEFACGYELSRMAAQIEQHITTGEVAEAFDARLALDNVPDDGSAEDASSTTMMRQICDRLSELAEFDG